MKKKKVKKLKWRKHTKNNHINIINNNHLNDEEEKQAFVKEQEQIDSSYMPQSITKLEQIPSSFGEPSSLIEPPAVLQMNGEVLGTSSIQARPQTSQPNNFIGQPNAGGYQRQVNQIPDIEELDMRPNQNHSYVNNVKEEKKETFEKESRSTDSENR